MKSNDNSNIWPFGPTGTCMLHLHVSMVTQYGRNKPKEVLNWQKMHNFETVGWFQSGSLALNFTHYTFTTYVISPTLSQTDFPVCWMYEWCYTNKVALPCLYLLLLPYTCKIHSKPVAVKGPSTLKNIFKMTPLLVFFYFYDFNLWF